MVSISSMQFCLEKTKSGITTDGTLVPTYLMPEPTDSTEAHMHVTFHMKEALHSFSSYMHSQRHHCCTLGPLLRNRKGDMNTSTGTPRQLM